MIKFIKRNIILIVLLSILLFLIFGCSAAKRTVKQVDDIAALRIKLEAEKQMILTEGIAKYVKENPCTFPEFNLDSLCEYYYTPTKTPEIGGIKNDTIKYYSPAKKILIPYEDKRHVKLLQDSVDVITVRLKECEAKAVGKKEAINEVVPLLIKPNKWAVNNWFWITLSLILLVITYSIFKIIKWKKSATDLIGKKVF